MLINSYTFEEFSQNHRYFYLPKFYLFDIKLFYEQATSKRFDNWLPNYIDVLTDFQIANAQVVIIFAHKICACNIKMKPLMKF